MNKNSPVTVCDIARKAGVAQSTVSSALHGTGRISDEGRKRIKRIAQQMGYQPRVAAQLLRSRQTGQLGIIIASPHLELFDNPWASCVLGRFVKRCEEEDRRYHIEVHQQSDDQQGSKPPVQVTGHLVDGVIVVGDVGEQLRNWLSEQKGLPWVSIMEPAELCVLPAVDRGTRAVVEHLAALGHRRIAHLAGNQCYLSQKLRHEAFLAAVKEFGLELPYEDWAMVIEASQRPEYASLQLQWTEQVMNRQVRPTAIIGGAHRAAIYVGLKKGMDIPGQLSVVGWEIRERAQNDFYPTLSSIECDHVTVLDTAWDLLQAKMSGQITGPVTRWIEPIFCPAQTSGLLRDK